jgi:hypothetical protein
MDEIFWRKPGRALETLDDKPVYPQVHELKMMS